MKDLSIIREILNTHGYVVKVELTDFGCLARFPEKKSHPPNYAFTISYYLDPNRNYIRAVTELDNKTYHEGIITGPRYAHKCLTVFHIIGICGQLKYSYSLLSFKIDDQEVGEETFLSGLTYPDLSEEESQKEQALIGLVVDAYNSGFSPDMQSKAEDLCVMDGYYAMVKMLEIEGAEDD